MREIIINPCDVIPLGHVGETASLQVQFDVTGWAETYGDGVYELVVLRPGETTPYMDVVTASGNYVLWDVSNVDTAIAGAGTCQLNYYVGTAIAKSQVHKTLTSAIVGASATPPDPYSTWLTNLQGIAADALADAQAAAQSATDAAEDADDASDSATLAESYAIGGTGTRSGEDTDNAKYYSEQIGNEVEQAAASATLSESWAVGGTDTRAGEDANNSKYYSEQSDNAKGIAEGARDASLGYMLDSSAWATGQISGHDVPSTNPAYENNSKYYSEQAASSATAADGSAEDAEAYAVGKRDGVDVTSGDPAFENNSKYYANEAANSASAAAASAATLTLDATLTSATQAAQAKAVGDALATKAEIDGYYDELTAGTAEQLIASVAETDKVPYNYRKSGGSADIGNRETDLVVGGSLEWNQLIQNGNFADTSNWSASNNLVSFTVQDNVAIMVIPSATGGTKRIGQTESFIASHKYLVAVTAKASSAITMRYYAGSGGANYPIVNTDITTEWANYSSIDEAISSASVAINIGCAQTLDNETTLYLKNFMLLDLTALFGSSIADYLYTLESNTAGAGAAIVKKLFPKLAGGYYAYNAGALMHVQTSSHEMTGLNQWDEVWESGFINTSTGADQANANAIRSANYCACLPSTEYGITKTAGRITSVYFYDAEKNFLGVKNLATASAFATVTTPSTAQYFRVRIGSNADPVTTYDNDVCVMIRWSGAYDGVYEPYELHQYALDSALTLRGIPKLDANNHLYYDGDTYSADGTVTRYYQERAYQAGDESLENAITDGTTTVVKLTTPTTEAATGYTNPQHVHDYGTERYVDYPYSQLTRDVEIPVGHTTEYMQNLRDKLQHLPDLASADGDYIVRQTGTQMALVQLPSAFPTTPNADGTYVLKCTVSGGTATLSWVAE